MPGFKWTEEEEKIVKENYENADVEQFKILLPNRTYRSIECTASRLGFHKPTKAWDPEELDILRKYYPISTPQEIQKMLPKRRNTTITVMANKLGIYRNGWWWTEEEDNLLKEHYANKTVKQIMEILPHKTNNGIKLRARKLGLWQDKSLPYRKYSYNYDFFSTPTVTNSYYAGLIAADGNVYGNILRIGLKDDDAYILEQFLKDVNYTGTLKFYNGKRGANSVVKETSKVRPTAVVCLSGAAKIINDLKQNYNIIPNKTLVLNPPSLVNYEHILSFIIGYIDGDGGIGISQDGYLNVSAAGTFSVLNWIKTIFDSISKKTNYRFAQILKQKNSNIWIYRVGGIRAYNILRILQAVHVPIRLERKWNKIKEYEELMDDKLDNRRLTNPH